MKINELVQQGTRTEYREVLVPAVYDEDGNVAEEARYETVEVEVPVMVAVTRDMTPDEIAEHERMQAAADEYERTRPRTVEEKLDATKSDVDMLADTVLALCDILEGE